MQLRFLAGVAVFGVDQVLRQRIENGRGAGVLQMRDGEINGFANDSAVLRDGGADQFRRQFKNMIRAEGGLDFFLRQFHAIAFYARKADFQSVAIWSHCVNAHGFDRGGWRRTTGLAVKSKGMPSTSAYSTLKSP